MWGYVTLTVAAVVVGWVVWRLLSRRTLLPCPAALSLLVEMENPLARATRSAHVIAQLRIGPGARVVDIGCGPGRVTIPLARAVGPEGEVVALDAQAAMLEKVVRKAEAEGLSNVRPLATDARRAAMPENSLDGAVMVMALGEIPDHAQVFAMICSALRPGGRLVVAESVFDPHYVRRSRVAALAVAAGLLERSVVGSWVAYAATFEKPDAATTKNPGDAPPRTPSVP